MCCALLACCALAWPANHAEAETARDVLVRASVAIATPGSLDNLDRVDAEPTTVAAHGTAEGGEPVPATLDASPKSPGTALAWAIGTTVVGWGMAAGGIAAGSPGLFIVGEAVSAFGPSAGHFYAGEIGHGFATSVVRGGALLAADVILVLAFEDEFEDDSGEGLFLGSLAVAAGLGLYDWIDAPRAARRANERNGFGLGFAPMAPDRDGRPILGFTLVRKF
jgi:hypothetical protein